MEEWTSGRVVEDWKSGGRGVTEKSGQSRQKSSAEEDGRKLCGESGRSPGWWGASGATGSTHR